MKTLLINAAILVAILHVCCGADRKWVWSDRNRGDRDRDYYLSSSTNSDKAQVKYEVNEKPNKNKPGNNNRPNGAQSDGGFEEFGPYGQGGYGQGGFGQGQGGFGQGQGGFGPYGRPGGGAGFYNPGYNQFGGGPYGPYGGPGGYRPGAGGGLGQFGPEGPNGFGLRPGAGGGYYGNGNGNSFGPQTFNNNNLNGNNRPFNRPGLFEPSFTGAIRPEYYDKCRDGNNANCNDFNKGGGRPIYSGANGVLVGPGGPFDIPPGSGNGGYRPNGGYREDGGNGLYPGSFGQPPRGPYDARPIYSPQLGVLVGPGGPFDGPAGPYGLYGGPFGKSADPAKESDKKRKN